MDTFDELIEKSSLGSPAAKWIQEIGKCGWWWATDPPDDDEYEFTEL